MQRVRIDIEAAILTKIKKEVPATGSSELSGNGHTYLKKQDTPKCSGDILDFPEFERNWANHVYCEKSLENCLN